MTICPACANGTVLSEAWEKEFQYRETTLSAEYTEEYCGSCGSLTLSAAALKKNMEKKDQARRAYDLRNISAESSDAGSPCTHEWTRDGQTMTSVRWYCTKCGFTKFT